MSHMFGSGSGGGGIATAEPIWLFGEPPGQINGPKLFQRFAMKSGDVGYGVNGVPANSLEGTLNTALGYNPYEDKQLNPLEGYDELAAAVGILINFNDDIHNGVLAVDADKKFQGPGTVATTFQDALKTLMTAADNVTTGLFKSADYDIASLISAIIGTSATGASAELVAALSNLTVNVGNLSRVSAATTDADASLLNADTRSRTSSALEMTSALAAGASVQGAAPDTSTALSVSANPMSSAHTAAGTYTHDDIELAISVIVDATTGLGSAITAALTAAESAMNSDLVDNAAEAFDDAGLPEHLMMQNRFAGQMVDINAVNGSAFILGQALLARGHQSDVADFRAKLSVQLYDRAFVAYSEMFRGSLELFLSQFTERIRERIHLYEDILSESTKAYLTGFVGHLDGYGRLVAGFLDSEKTSLGHQTQLVDRFVSEHGSSFRAIADRHISGSVQSKLDWSGRRGEYMSNVNKNLYTTLALGLGVQSDVAGKLVQVESEIAEADTNLYLKNIELKKADYMWEFDLIGKGMSYLGTPAGVYTPPERATPFQNALAGAGAGAGVAGVPGAVVGGLLGLFAG